MIRILLIVVLLIPVCTYSKLTEETCRGIMQHAKWVMLSKQIGKPIDEVLKENDQWFKDASKAEKNKANLTIQTAYSLPSYNDKELNKQQLNDFIAYEYLACKKAMN